MVDNLIYIAEDSDDVRTFLENILNRREIKSTSFKCGRELLESLDRASSDGVMPKVVILDNNYCGYEIKQGTEYCREIKAKYLHIKVIGMSGGDIEVIKPVFLGAGADVFFAKPKEINKMIFWIQEYLAR